MPDGTLPEERANTARLNAEQAARAKAENIAYDQQVQAVACEDAAAQAAFAEETAVYEAEKARAAAMSADARMAWEADVAACKAGATSRCSAPSAPAPPHPCSAPPPQDLTPAWSCKIGSVPLDHSFRRLLTK